MPEKEIREAFEKVCSPEAIVVKHSMNSSLQSSGISTRTEIDFLMFLSGTIFKKYGIVFLSATVRL